MTSEVSFSHFFGIAALAVIQTLVVSTAGVLIKSRLTGNGAHSIKGISYTSVFIFLPCLLFHRMATRFSVSVLEEAYLVLLFSVIRLAIGFVIGMLSNIFGFVPRSYHGVTVLGCLSPNAVAVPLSLLYGLQRDVPWLRNPSVVAAGGGDGAQSSALQSASVQRHLLQEFSTNGSMMSPIQSEIAEPTPMEYLEILVFVYAIPCNFCLWSVGNFFIKTHSERCRKEEAALEHSGEDQQASEERSSYSLKRFFKEYIKPSLSPPIIATWTGITVACIPFMKYLVTEQPVVGIAMNGLKTVGDGAIPVALVVLGLNLAMSTEAASVEPKLKKKHHAVEESKSGGEGDNRGVEMTAERRSSSGQRDDDDECADEEEEEEEEENQTSVVFCDAEVMSNTSIVSEAWKSASATPKTGPSKKSATKSTPEARKGSPSSPSLPPSPPPLSTVDGALPAPVSVTVVAVATNQSPPPKEEGVALKGWDAVKANLPPQSLTIIITVTQLILLPLATFVLVMMFTPIQGSWQEGGSSKVDKFRIMLLLILTEGFCPSAMNGPIICALHDYRQTEYSLLLVVQYVVAIGSMAAWLTAVLMYLA